MEPAIEIYDVLMAEMCMDLEFIPQLILKVSLDQLTFVEHFECH